MPNYQKDNAVFWNAKTASWADLAKDASNDFKDCEEALSKVRFLYVIDHVEEALKAIVHGMSNNFDFGLIEESRLSEELVEKLDENAVCRFWPKTKKLEGPQTGEAIPGQITVLTSGTTGLLKLIPHRWETLNTYSKVSKLPINTWFVPYQIGSYAWYQMISLGLFKQGQSLAFADFNDLGKSFAEALPKITAISSTPTFWRMQMMNIEHSIFESSPLKTISLGGEIVDQAILDELKNLYPTAQIRHIFASSEAGASIVTTDGIAGFPESYLVDDDSKTIGIKIDEGMLHIKSPYSTVYAETGQLEWVNTGDLVERRNGRVFILGRAGNKMINVGGMKAFPSDIEAHLLSHPAISWAQVYPKRAPFIGNLAAAKVVLNQTLDKETAEEELTKFCNASLAEYAVPRFWEFLDEIPMRSSLKS